MTSSTSVPAPVVRSIDLGYGQVKYSCASPVGGSPSVVLRHFPARVVPVISTIAQRGTALVGQAQVLTPEVQGAQYYVGAEIDSVAGTTAGRRIESNYARTPQYDALMKGALAYMGEKYIDCLALGLAVSRYRAERQRLIDCYRASNFDHTPK
jgi:plasmid segregation protein ParM